MAAAGAVTFAEEVNASADGDLFSVVRRLEHVTVFAPVDAAFGKRRRQMMQSDGTGYRTDDWGAYMAAEYLEFEQLVERASQLDNTVDTVSLCGGFRVRSVIDDNQVQLVGPSGEEVLLDRRDAVPGNGQVMVHPIQVLLRVHADCKCWAGIVRARGLSTVPPSTVLGVFWVG